MTRRHRSAQGTPAAIARLIPHRPELESQPSQFMLIERQVEDEFHPQILGAIQKRVDAISDSVRAQDHKCPRCKGMMNYHDAPMVSWISRFGTLQAHACRFRCHPCQEERRPLLEFLGVEPGRISGSLTRLLALLAVVCPYELAARLALLFFGVKISAMGVWGVVQRLGQAAAQYSDDLSAYHSDCRSEAAPAREARLLWSWGLMAVTSESRIENTGVIAK